jgi:hypothetical protein
MKSIVRLLSGDVFEKMRDSIDPDFLCFLWVEKLLIVFVESIICSQVIKIHLF